MLTPKRSQIVNYISKYTARTGTSPILSEIARHMCVGPAAASYHMRLLVKHGYLKKVVIKNLRGWEVVDGLQGITPEVESLKGAWSPSTIQERVAYHQGAIDTLKAQM